MFRFKQFVVRDEQCGMKVGTDGTLLGAWVPVDGVSAVSLPEKVGTVARVLDVGTGSGLIALMIAQRCPQAQVLGIDIDEAARPVKFSATNLPKGLKLNATTGVISGKPKSKGSATVSFKATSVAKPSLVGPALKVQAKISK